MKLGILRLQATAIAICVIGTLCTPAFAQPNTQQNRGLGIVYNDLSRAVSFRFRGEGESRSVNIPAKGHFLLRSYPQYTASAAGSLEYRLDVRPTVRQAEGPSAWQQRMYSISTDAEGKVAIYSGFPTSWRESAKSKFDDRLRFLGLKEKAEEGESRGWREVRQRLIGSVVKSILEEKLSPFSQMESFADEGGRVSAIVGDVQLSEDARLAISTIIALCYRIKTEDVYVGALNGAFRVFASQLKAEFQGNDRSRIKLPSVGKAVQAELMQWSRAATIKATADELTIATEEERVASKPADFGLVDMKWLIVVRIQKVLDDADKENIQEALTCDCDVRLYWKSRSEPPSAYARISIPVGVLVDAGNADNRKRFELGMIDSRFEKSLWGAFILRQ